MITMKIKKLKYDVAVVKVNNIYHIVRLMLLAHPIQNILNMIVQIYYPAPQIDYSDLDTLIRFILPKCSVQTFLNECMNLYENDESAEGEEIRKFINRITSQLHIA